jgi:GT2 family glycosyltransferase
MDVSTVIVNWNTGNILRDCLKSVYEQTQGISFEVIVIDNASLDGSADIVRKQFPQVILIENDENRGFAPGVNQGMAVAKGRYVLVLNSDTIICDNAIEKTIRYADKYPKAGITGCQVLDDSGTIQMTCFRFPSVLNLFLHTFALNKIFKKNHFFGREWMLWWPRDTEREVEVISGSFMLVRRDAIDDVGLMDEDYFLYYEETDWCYRFAKAGWKKLFWPEAKIIHCHGGRNSSKQESLKMAVQMQKSCLIFFKKHRHVVSYITVRLILMVSSACRFGFWTIALFVKHLLRNSSNHERKKIAEKWSVFKYCAFGCEPLRTTNKSQCCTH